MCTSPVYRVVMLLLVVDCCCCRSVRHTQSQSESIWHLESFTYVDHQHPVLTTRCLKYSTEDSCQLYECVTEQTRCPSVERSVAYQLCVGVKQQQQQQQRHYQQRRRHSDVLAWAERISHCLMQRLAGHLNDESTQCASVERMMRADLHACTQLTDISLCRQLLLLQQQETMQLFSQLNWMWLVEMTRSCPRVMMARFISWAISRSADVMPPASTT